MSNQEIAMQFITILGALTFAFHVGLKTGKKVKVGAAERLRFKFRADLVKLERSLILKNNDKVSRVHNSLDSDIIKVKLIKRELGDFVHGRVIK